MITELNEKELLIALEREVSTRSLFAFFKMATVVLYPAIEWDYNFHFEYLCVILQDNVERISRGETKDKDLLANLPFRSGKSILISIIFPVWVWIRNPALSIISVSATDMLATKFGHQSKILIDSEWFQLRFGNVFQIRRDQHAKGSYMNTSGGRREAFGINSGIIGSGCDIMILDDIQSPDNITPLGLNNTIQSFQDVLYSRMNNPLISWRICLQQRVHENDISGYLVRNSKEKWLHVCIPAILTEDLQPKELSKHYVNKLFWHSRFSQKVLDDFKSTMRAAPYAGQLLQRPQPEEGDVIKRQWFKKIKWSTIMDLRLEWHVVLDTAFTNKTTNDPTGILIVAKYNNNILIKKAARKWLMFHELLEEIREIKKVNNGKIYIEEKGSGISIVQELKRASNYNVITLHPKDKDKLTRVNAIQPYLQSNRVILVEDDWNDMFLSECASFPFGLHDDLVDCLAYTCEQFLSQNSVTIMKTI